MKLKYRVIERFRGKYSVEAMCEVFDTMRGGSGKEGKQRINGWLI